MKILVISSYLPYPLFSGGHVRLYNLIKELARRHEITLICEKRPNQTESDISEVKKICKDVITVARQKQWSVGNVLKAGISSNSFLQTGHTSPGLQKKIQKVLIHHSFDVIHVETYYVMDNMPATKIPLVLVEHNIEYNVYEKFKEKAPIFLRPFLSFDIAKIKKEEEGFWKKANGLVAVSHEDQMVMQKAGVSATIVPNGVNIEEFVYKKKHHTLPEKEKRVLFLGDFKWIQNRDAVGYMIKDIWPKIKKDSNATLWIVGRHIPEGIKNLTTDPTIFFDEKSSAKPTPEIFQEASVLLAPIRIGGGTSYKILEAMASGTPVVTMQMSADALGAKDEDTLMVGNNALELAEKTVTLLQDNALYDSLSQKGRKLVEENYTWNTIGKILENVYFKLTSQKNTEGK